MYGARNLGPCSQSGFNSTTEISAYFRYLCLLECATNHRLAPSSSPVWPRLPGTVLTTDLVRPPGQDAEHVRAGTVSNMGAFTRLALLKLAVSGNPGACKAHLDPNSELHQTI